MAILSDQTHLKTKQTKNPLIFSKNITFILFLHFPSYYYVSLLKKIWSKYGLNSSISFSKKTMPYLFSLESDILNTQITYLHNCLGDTKIILSFVQRNMCIFLRFLEILKILISLICSKFQKKIIALIIFIYHINFSMTYFLYFPQLL